MRHDEYQYQGQAAGHDFMSGLLFGGLMGVAVGLLFAPKAGAEIRGDVARQARQARRKAEDTYGQASSFVHDAVDRGRDAWKKGRDSFHETRDNVTREAASMMDRAADAVDKTM